EWRSVSPMAFGRRQMNATLLPDGKVLVTGGSSSPGFNNATKAVLAAEMWDPSTETWSTMSRMQVMRLYHSTALLLPDGRVLSAGGGLPPSPNARDTDHPDVEIYSPPYLFKGPRPSITSSPAAVTHDRQFFIGTPDATGITKVTLIRLSSVTHAFNQNQRINILSYRQTPGGLSVRAPGSGSLCPPGYYMLFIVNGNGVPSVAQIIQVRSPASATNTIDDQRFFVRQLYYDVLGREPDQGGWNGWMSYIDQCGNDQQCLMNNRGITARSFMDSAEFRRNKPALTNPGTPEYYRELIRQCYLVFLRREPAPDEYNAWLNHLNSTRDETTMINGFIHSAEYRNRFSRP
ncbi:MAG TPA: galactose oxidase-like domain-containing protein, partial [Blastocatellia bacterium]